MHVSQMYMFNVQVANFSMLREKEGPEASADNDGQVDVNQVLDQVCPPIDEGQTR